MDDDVNPGCGRVHAVGLIERRVGGDPIQEERIKKRFKLRGKAREFALGYDADTVLHQYWKPVLESLEVPA